MYNYWNRSARSKSHYCKLYNIVQEFDFFHPLTRKMLFIASSMTRMTFASLTCNRSMIASRAPLCTRLTTCSTAPPLVKFVTAHTASLWVLKSPLKKIKIKKKDCWATFITFVVHQHPWKQSFLFKYHYSMFNMPKRGKESRLGRLTFLSCSTRAGSRPQVMSCWICLLGPAAMLDNAHAASFCVLAFGCLISWGRTFKTPASMAVWVCRSDPLTMLPIDRRAGVWR